MDGGVIHRLFVFQGFYMSRQLTRNSTPIASPTAAGPNVSRMPVWIRQPLGDGGRYGKTARAVSDQRLHTVCEEARCPNRGECWGRGTATFMLLGDTCTRACGFCSVKTGRPGATDQDEPARVREAVARLDLRYVVLTSVNRDDLPDGGAGIFAETVRQLRLSDPRIGVELLTPDFHRCQAEAITTVMAALAPGAGGPRPSPPLVWGHNMETVPRLYRLARKGSDYARSLRLLALAARQPGVEAKSALMLGLGETKSEVLQTMEDLRASNVELLTIGQYLRPTKRHHPVIRFYHPDEFKAFETAGLEMGFKHVAAGPLVRSSYHADDFNPPLPA